MQQLHTDIVQSFWLRFWREPHQGQVREWRGTIWHEQQAEHERPTAIANPEEAFEFVRNALRISSGPDAAPDAIPPATSATMAAEPRGWLRRLFASGLSALRRRNREPKP